jgi:predicted transposase YdaD
VKTDKHIYQLFRANPDWLFELTGLASPGASTFRTFTVKALQREADGVVVPDDTAQPLTVVEVQFQADETIYQRIVTEMAAVQVEQPGRAVQGIILFRYPHLDPHTAPWTHVVRSFVLRDVLEALAARQPEHPLVAVFQPVLVQNAQTLERQAVQYYRRIKMSSLAEPLKTTLLEVFISWLEQRFIHKGKKEIETMLLGDLPDLEETQSGKDLIAIGIKRALLTYLAEQHSSVPEGTRQRIQALELEPVQELLRLLYRGMSLEQLEAWLAARSV